MGFESFNNVASEAKSGTRSRPPAQKPKPPQGKPGKGGRDNK